MTVNFNQIWASNALAGELIDMPLLYYLRGWGYLNPQEPPPMEFFNYLFNLQDTKTKKLADIIGVWQENENVLKGYIRIPTENKASNIYLVCVSETGTTGAIEPVWGEFDKTVTDGTVVWQIIPKIAETGNGMPIGTIYHALCTDTPEGSVRLDGTEFTQEIFPDFYQMLADGKIPSITYAQWETAFNQNDGDVGVAALDTVNKKFKVPAIADGTFIASVQNGTIGEYFKAGLPNITGSSGWVRSLYPQGSFYTSAAASTVMNNNETVVYPQLSFDASLSNSIYGNSETVTPKHIRYPLFMVLYNKAQTASEAQYGQFITAVEGKANKDFSNVTPLAKSTAVSWAMPDYNGGISVSFPLSTNKFIAPADGVYVVQFVVAPGGYTQAYINNNLTSYAVFSAGSSRDSFALTIILSKTDELYFTTANDIGYNFSSKFYPMKGAV